MLHKVVTIRYSKVLSEDEAETTDRTIIPTQVPGNIQAIDVTGLEVDKQVEISNLYSEYSDYLNVHIKAAFSFENWLSHSKGVDFTPKWRTFKPDQTEIIF